MADLLDAQSSVVVERDHRALTPGEVSREFPRHGRDFLELHELVRRLDSFLDPSCVTTIISVDASGVLKYPGVLPDPVDIPEREADARDQIGQRLPGSGQGQDGTIAAENGTSSLSERPSNTIWVTP